MGEVDVQRRITDAFIKARPKTVVLIPRDVTTINTNGVPAMTPLTPRPAQTFYMSELSFDQRPTVTVNGVERVIDYHMIGRHDAQIAVGDHWTEGTVTYEVVGFSDGFMYERKAYVARHIPPAVTP